MMLRSKHGQVQVRIFNNEKGTTTNVRLNDYLTPEQIRALSDKPDMLWQFCQRLATEYTEKGEKIAIYVDCKVSVNGRPLRTFIDPNVNMATAKWDYFFHNEWILPSKFEE